MEQVIKRAQEEGNGLIQMFSRCVSCEAGAAGLPGSFGGVEGWGAQLKRFQQLQALCHQSEGSEDTRG